MKIGYARVSTKDQLLDLQLDALKKTGCKKIYQEVLSGTKTERPILQELLANLREDDVLVIWKLDRLGRSLRHLVDIVNQLNARKIGLLSLNDPIDTTTSHGRLTFNLFASLAEFERDIIRERTQAGLSAARARGKRGCRPSGLPKHAESIACAALRQYAPSFLANIQFENEATYSGCIINAIDLLREMNQENKRKLPGDVPLQFMPTKLQKMVAPLGVPNKQAWECALLTCLRDEIRSGNLAVTGSKRYGRFDHFFILDAEWEQIRQEFFQRAQLPSDPEKVEDFLKRRLNAAYDQFLEKQANNHYAHIENNRLILSVDPAEELSQEQKIALEKLQSWLTSHMRSIKLPELLIEVDNDLHFTNLFMLPSQQNKRLVDDVCAILVTIMAHGCFIGPYTMARLTQGISYEQIRRVTDWQMTEDSQRLALALVVNAIAKIDVSQCWGDGKTSSSDGQRFEFKRKSLAQTYSTKFGDFALEFYTFVADNYAPFYSMPIECTDRDASYVLDGILYNESDLALDEHYTDTHGFTEINFAAFAMLGKKFSPRIKGLHHQRLYRIDSNRDYGPLAPLVSGSERQVNLAYIVKQWDRMGQFYASLERGHATASTALKRLVGFSEKNHFFRANRDLGRIFKTENILEDLSDPLYCMGNTFWINV
jgi:TnpA family transposase